MKKSHMPSILCFSTILLFYGGKLEIRRLLFCLSKGGGQFFQEKVKNGHFFKSRARDSNHINLNQTVVEMYNFYRNKNLNAYSERVDREETKGDFPKYHNALFRDMLISVDNPSGEIIMRDFKKIVCGHFKAHNGRKTMKFQNINLYNIQSELANSTYD